MTLQDRDPTPPDDDGCEYNPCNEDDNGDYCPLRSRYEPYDTLEERDS